MSADVDTPVTLVAIDPDRMLVSVDNAPAVRVHGYSVGRDHVRVQLVGDPPGPWRRYDGAQVVRAEFDGRADPTVIAAPVTEWRHRIARALGLPGPPLTDEALIALAVAAIGRGVR